MDRAEAEVTSRDTVLASVRRSLGVSGNEVERHAAVAQRLSEHPRGVIPQRGQLAPTERVALFRRMIAAAAGTATQVSDPADVPREIAALLRAHNLPMAVRHGADPRLVALPWERERTLSVATGPSDGSDLVGVSYALGAVAESGTLMLLSGADNPTTLNFLPDTHVVIVSAQDIAGDYETLWQRLRDRFGPGTLPRTVNLITGPSRSADVEQTLILGAHGPRRLHVIVVG
jgi:L-lactate dehydrogenase complex protein LldG